MNFKFYNFYNFIIELKMGKKDVIMDNGKKAQSSMALYWKKNKQKSKNPQQKVISQQKEQQLSDKRVISNFQKWKLHKEKIITKAYTKPNAKVDQTAEKQLQKKQDQQQQQALLQKMYRQKAPKSFNLPGFSSKSQLLQKLHTQTPSQPDQSTNILKLPQHLQLTEQQILHILREKKSKQKARLRIEEKQDVLLGDQFVDLMKNKQKEQIRKKQQQQKEEEKRLQDLKPKPTFFKSLILNKIEKQGIQKGLEQTIKKPQVIQTVVQTIRQMQAEVNHVQKQSLQVKMSVQQARFMPRVLKK